jgi:hypothetical protein
MARSIKAYFKLKIDNVELYGRGTVAGLKKTRESTKALRDGTDGHDVYVGPTTHDNVTVSGKLTTGSRGNAKVLNDTWEPHGTNDPDNAASTSKIELYLYSDQKLSSNIGNYLMNRCKIVSLGLDGLDADANSADPVMIESEFAVGDGGWADA